MSQKSVDDKNSLLSFIQLPFLPLGDAADACYKEQETKEKAIREGEVSDFSSTLSPNSASTLPSRPYYRRNVACYFINEHGQVLACLRTDGRSWGTVQGGVEDDDANNNDANEKDVFPHPTSAARMGGANTADDIDASAMMIPTRGRPHDPTLLKAALREIEEEIGLSIGTLQGLGCEYMCTVNPPTAAELEALLIRRLRWEREAEAEAGRKGKGVSNNNTNEGQDTAPGGVSSTSPAAAASLTSFQFDAEANRIEWNAAQIESLSCLEADPSRFFTYEFGALRSGTSERRRRFLGQSQTQMVFFLPSRAISFIRLLPSQKFIAVAWMLPHQFVPLCIPFEQRIMAFVLMHAADFKRDAATDADADADGGWQTARYTALGCCLSVLIVGVIAMVVALPVELR